MECHGMMYSGGHGCRSFLTKDEKIDILNDYKEYLEKEAKGVTERIEQLKKG